MVRVSGYLCVVCGHVASYKKPEETRPRYCSRHGKEIEASSVVRVCQCPQRKQPVFGYPEDPRPTCCSSCKVDDMVNILKLSRCVVCNKQANFGQPGTRRRTHCSSHGKPLGMVDLMTLFCPCGSGTSISFGFASDRKRIACGTCKSDDMVNLKNPYCDCCEPGSETIASFGFAEGPLI